MEPRFVDTSSLRQFLLAAAGKESDPYVICERILAGELSVLELRVIAEACLPGWAWEQMKRPHSRYEMVADAPETVSATIAPTFNDGTMPRTFVDSQGIQRAGWRQVAFLDDYGKRLNQAVKVGDATSDRKRLAECTVADLKWMADYRYNVAEKNLATATQLTDLATALETAGVDTVADLPREVGEKILLK